MIIAILLIILIHQEVNHHETPQHVPQFQQTFIYENRFQIPQEELCGCPDERRN